MEPQSLYNWCRISKVKGLEKCANCKAMAFNKAYCLNCGYPGKVSRKGRKKK